MPKTKATIEQQFEKALTALTDLDEMLKEDGSKMLAMDVGDAWLLVKEAEYLFLRKD